MVPSRRAGIYVASISPDPHSLKCLSMPPLSNGAIAGWISYVGTITVDGSPATQRTLKARLSRFWLPDETILYIGKAGGENSSATLCRRVADYYCTPLGDPRPHSGGHWIKTLTNLGRLYIHWVEAGRAEAIETQLIELFASRVSKTSRMLLHDRDHAYPFANLKNGGRKGSGIGRSRRPRTSRTD